MYCTPFKLSVPTPRLITDIAIPDAAAQRRMVGTGYRRCTFLPALLAPSCVGRTHSYCRSRFPNGVRLRAQAKAAARCSGQISNRRLKYTRSVAGEMLYCTEHSKCLPRSTEPQCSMSTVPDCVTPSRSIDSPDMVFVARLICKHDQSRQKRNVVGTYSP